MKMQDKRAAQQADQERHKAALQAAKARRQGIDLARPAPARTEHPMILIVCQGERTEVDYFNLFELATATIKTASKAYDPEKLVDYARTLREQATADDRPYEQVWCVFDKDDSSAQQVHASLSQAKAANVRVAFSNQAFEYWLLLHFLDHNGAGLDRKVCTTRLSELVAQVDPAIRYDGFGSKRISRAFFDLLEADVPVARSGRQPRRKVAIGRGRKIAAAWKAQGIEPAYQESTTWVYRLVEELQQHLPPHSAV